jgi:hypothetical protein
MKDMRPLVINAKLQIQGHEPETFQSYTWLDFMIKVNQFMDDNNWISFPMGEDDEIKMVTKKAKESEKLVR